jgi:anion-transporting  ArsA/GET3 family ATPase
MEEGFRERARRVEDLLADPGTSFVLVVAPREDSIDESWFFARRLAEGSIAVGALVVNRLFSDFGPDQATAGGVPPQQATDVQSPAPALPERFGASPPDPLAYEELRRNLEDFLVVATREERYVAELAGEVAPAPVVRVPFLSEDVHDIEGLRVVARYLVGGQLVSDRGSHTDRQ